MIDTFVAAYEKGKDVIRQQFSAQQPNSYVDIVKAVVSVIHNNLDDDTLNKPDAENIHTIDDGDYQGTLLFVIPETGWQPSTYWAVYVGYGSCSGCDTLQAIREYADDPPQESQVDDYMTLALHVVQGIKEI